MDERKTPEIAIKYIEFLKKKDSNIKKAYLFGSYAKGTVSSDSDIALAIVYEDRSV